MVGRTKFESIAAHGQFTDDRKISSVEARRLGVKQVNLSGWIMSYVEFEKCLWSILPLEFAIWLFHSGCLAFKSPPIMKGEPVFVNMSRMAGVSLVLWGIYTTPM